MASPTFRGWQPGSRSDADDSFDDSTTSSSDEEEEEEEDSFESYDSDGDPWSDWDFRYRLYREAMMEEEMHPSDADSDFDMDIDSDHLHPSDGESYLDADPDRHASDLD